MNKLLTISIAAYNVEKYLEKALKSCLVQEDLRKYLEVIVVNDGSTDKTLDVANQFAKEYSDIFNIIDKKNGGYGSTINASLAVATGKYFRILDGDDWIDTEVLEHLLIELQACQEDVIFTNSRQVYMDGDKVIKTHIVSYGNESANKTLCLNKESKLIWLMHNMTVRTGLLLQNKVNILENCFYTDGEFVFYVMYYMKNYRGIQKEFYHYRLGRTGQSVSMEGRIRHRSDILRVLKKELNYIEGNSFNNDINKSYVMQHVANTGVATIQYHLLCPCNKMNREIVKEIDLEIKKRNIEIFRRMGRKKAIIILRFFYYYSYRICRWNELRKLCLNHGFH